MTYTWHTMSTADERVQVVDCWESLDSALAALARDSWEDTSRKLVDWIADENGEIVAVSIFNAELELVVACSDGRIVTYPQPDWNKD